MWGATSSVSSGGEVGATSSVSSGGEVGATSSVNSGGEVGGYIKCEHWRRSGGLHQV